MSEVKNIPSLRFPSFFDEWKQDKLEKVINFQNGVGHERSIDENGNVVVVNSKFISTEGTVRKYTDKVLSIIPDDSLCMVMSDIPNGKAIAKCYYFEKGDYFSLNQRICSIKSETEVNKFLFYRINRHKYYLKFDNGVGQTNLRKSEVLNCPIKLPSLQEQQKIADFLTAVDKRIELLVKKKTLLETYKKGVMKKIFNQEIRFKDDSGSDFPDWEECKMGEIIDILSDYTANGSFGGLKENVQYYTEINFAALVRTTDLEKKLFNPQRFTDKRGYDYLSKTSLFGGEIIMANVGSIGKIYRCPESSFPMTLAPNTYMIKFKKKLINEGFIFQLMKRKTFKNKLLSMVGSSTLKAINKKNLRSIKVNIPSMEEQDKLNNFLFSIDTQLKLLESQIDKSKTWKKGLLQKMFV